MSIRKVLTGPGLKLLDSPRDCDILLPAHWA